MAIDAPRCLAWVSSYVKAIEISTIPPDPAAGGLRTAPAGIAQAGARGRPGDEEGDGQRRPGAADRSPHRHRDAPLDARVGGLVEEDGQQPVRWWDRGTGERGQPTGDLTLPGERCLAVRAAPQVQPDEPASHPWQRPVDVRRQLRLHLAADPAVLAHVTPTSSLSRA